MNRRNGAHSIKAAVAVAALLVVASGCGGDDKSDAADDFAKKKADDIVATAKADMKELDSVHYTGELSSGGQEISLDIRATSDGTCAGSFGVGEGSAEILGVDGENWFKPNEAFWRVQAPDQADAIIAAVGDKWVADSSGEFTQFCDLDALLDDVLDESAEGATYTVDGTEEIDGETVVKVDREDEGEDGVSSGYVLAESPHYLVKIAKTSGDDAGTLTFAEFNEDVTVEAPAADEVVDLNSIG
jgi:hypothetical protein